MANYNNQTEIDISAIANGMYLLHIQTPNGNLVKQVVVNK
ncbi:MAG: T9SS type A sorting domain-containing protein [Candidatus Methylacidiphilales bacterium]